MADQSDVEETLAGLVTAILYPQGPEAASAIGTTCRIYRGWPVTAALDADMAAGVVNVSVFGETGAQQNTTRFPDEELVPRMMAPTLTAAVAGSAATFAGVAAPGQLAGLLADGFGVVHRTLPGDTPDSVAAILAGLMRERRVTLLAGATVTVPGAIALRARVVADQTTLRETRRQRQPFRISCWCPDPVSRDACAAAIDSALSAEAFIALPDTTAGRLRFEATHAIDQGQNAGLFRRDLVYSVEYATTLRPVRPSMIFGAMTLAGNDGPAVVGPLS